MNQWARIIKQKTDDSTSNIGKLIVVERGPAHKRRLVGHPAGTFAPDGPDGYDVLWWPSDLITHHSKMIYDDSCLPPFADADCLQLLTDEECARLDKEHGMEGA